MSAPYLNRGESIILTTHRMIVDSVEYDAILTSERLILMDSRYTRFEPRIIPLSHIMTVKGGKTPAADPAIILTLEEPGILKEPENVSLVFSQEQGEQRKDDREVWVKKLIELAITAREQSAKKSVLPVQKKRGMQPSVRRFEAPETPRPHTSVPEPVTVRPKVVEVTVEPDSPGFSIKDLPPPVPEAPEEEVPEDTYAGDKAGEDNRDLPEVPEIALPASEMAIGPGKEPEPVAAIETRMGTPIPGVGPVPEADLPLPELLPDRSGFEAGGLPEPEEEPAAPAIPAASFASTISAALDDLRAQPVLPEPLDTSTPPLPEKDYPGTTLPAESWERVETPAPVPEIPEEPEPPAETGYGVDPHLSEHASDQEPAQAPEATVPVPAMRAEPRSSPAPLPAAPRKERGGIPLLPVAILILVAILVLVGGIILAAHYLQGDTTESPVVTHAPTVTIAPTPLLTVAPQTGMRVNVVYPYDFSGTLGDPGRLRQVSGIGNQTFPLLMTSDIIQATIQKQDNSVEAMTVEIYDNSTLLTSKTVTAPMGEINILIDVKTGRSPGMTVDTQPVNNRTLLGNGSLIYF